MTSSLVKIMFLLIRIVLVSFAFSGRRECACSTAHRVHEFILTRKIYFTG